MDKLTNHILSLKNKLLELDKQHQIKHQNALEFYEEEKNIETKIHNSYERISGLQLFELKENNNINNNIKKVKMLIGFIWLLISIPVFNLLLSDVSINYFIIITLIETLAGISFTGVSVALIKKIESQKENIINSANSNINEEKLLIEELTNEKHINRQKYKKEEANIRDIECKRSIIEYELTKTILKQVPDIDNKEPTYSFVKKKTK